MKLAIALFFNVGDEEDGFVKKLIHTYSNETGPIPITFHLGPYLAPNIIEDFWFYLGSTTIPPCTNAKLNWVVVNKVFSMTQEQKEDLLEIMSQGEEDWPGNWRAAQPLNANPVGFRSLKE